MYILYSETKKDGGAGYRSPCPSHAKRVLYHLSYTPIQTKGRDKGVMTVVVIGVVDVVVVVVVVR